jgi:hypothetical protein
VAAGAARPASGACERSSVPSQAGANICSMAHARYVREKAREMRIERRLTIDQIAERLALPRSTIYYWVRDLPITDAVRHSGPRQAARRRGNRAMQRKYRLLREDAYREGLESFASLAADPTFRDFVCLYIAEGYKRSRNAVSIVNSDPAVVRVAAEWIRRLAKRVHRLPNQLPRRPELGGAALVLGFRAWHRPALHSLPAEDQQRPVVGSCLALRARSAHDQNQRHAFRARLDAWIVCLKREWGRE